MKQILHTYRALGTLGQSTRKVVNRLIHIPNVTPDRRDGWMV